MGTLSPALTAPWAQAAEVSAGFAAVEQMDDRLEPAAMVHFGFSDVVGANAYYYGRLYGPVRTDTFLVSLHRRWDLFQSKMLTAHFGLALMDERIALKYSQPQYAAYNQEKDAYNAGFTSGIAWELLPHGPLHFTVAWDAHIFPAGGNGTAFLVTARKQTLGLTMGVAF